MNRGFPKEEHLCSYRLIERLYAEGNRFRSFPYRVQWRVEPGLAVPCQVLIVAPKRLWHHAVDRNRIKRLTRECYRMHKEQLYAILQAHQVTITLSLTYTHNELPVYEELYHKFDKLLVALEKELSHEDTVQCAEVAAQ